MIKCSVVETGTPEFLERLENVKKLDLTDIGEIIRKRMIGIIDRDRKRNPKVSSERYPKRPYRAHLKNSLIVQATAKGVEIAVDEKKTPYWAYINYGGPPPGPVRGQFVDGGPLLGSFAYNPNMPKMIPKKPIDAMNYLEKTDIWVKQNIQKYIDKAIEAGAIGSKFTNRFKTSKILKNFTE